jgi:polyisoprenoid-binding protein YceI
MKNLQILFTAILLSAGLFTIQCTHDDEDLNPEGPIPEPIERGDDMVSFNDNWSFDKTHSSVRWHTAYLGTAALLTGRFNDFIIEIEFDEDNPENIVVSGQVQLSSVNTGEPGRDQGCLRGTFGIEDPDLDTFEGTNLAIFESTEVVFDESDPTGYIVTGNLTFHGVTSDLQMKLNYLGTDLLDLRGTPTNVAGFEGQFEFNAKSVFGIESSNIADRIVININAQFKQPQI